MFLILLVFTNLFPQLLVPSLFPPTLLVSRPSVRPPFLRFLLLSFPLPSLMVDPTLRLFSPSLVVFPHPFRFFPASLSVVLTVLLFIHFCVVFHTLVLNKPVVFGALFCFFPPVICFVRIPLRFFTVWVFIFPFVSFPPFWCCSLSCFCSNFFGFPNQLQFSPSPLLLFCRQIWVSLPSLSVSLPPSPFWSSSPSPLAHPLRFLPMCFSPSSRVFSSLAVSLSVFRSLSLSEKQVDKK